MSSILLGIDPYSVDTAPQHKLGTRGAVTPSDDRIFKYAKVGGSAISAGKLQQAPAVKTNHVNMTTAAASAGATTVTVTLGATAATANEYAEGYLVVNAGTGLGQIFKVASHPAIGSGASGVITLDPATPIKVALDTTSKTTLIHNTYNGVIEATTQTNAPAGVSLVAASASQYVWLCTHGKASVLAGGTIAVGSDVVPDGSTAGAVAAVSGTFTTALATVKVGSAIVAGVSNEYRPIYLTID